MKLVMKFPLFLSISLNFKMGNGKLFSVLFQSTIYSLALKKGKRDCKLPKIILVERFCPLKTEIARCAIEFRLNLLINRLSD